jgi:hypothetical protein
MTMTVSNMLDIAAGSGFGYSISWLADVRKYSAYLSTKTEAIHMGYHDNLDEAAYAIYQASEKRAKE